MSKTKQLTPITPKQIAAMGVQSLADRPNAAGGYGQSGLSALQLKLWFDKLVTLAADKINELQSTLSTDDAASYIRIALEESGVENLKDLIDSMESGVLAESILRVYPSAAAQKTELLQAVLNSIAQSLSEFDERISKNYIKGDRGDTGLMIMTFDGDTLVLRSENHLLTVENETLKLI